MIVADSGQQPKGMGVHFIGNEGWVHVNRRGIDAFPKSVLAIPLKPNDIHLYKSDDHIQNFIDCVRSRKQTITPAEVAHHSIMIGHLGHASMKLAKKLYWDHSIEKFIDDPQADRFLTRPMRGPWHI